MIEKETREMDAGKLLGELVILRKRIQELESSEAERRRLEEALRDSEERFAQFMHYLCPDGQTSRIPRAVSSRSTGAFANSSAGRRRKDSNKKGGIL
ncbi:MAG: hypothetical protein KKF28_04135 [Proteobacteria bacterium]|nr:hypothetical protein [Pseudomonadota bacterium]